MKPALLLVALPLVAAAVHGIATAQATTECPAAAEVRQAHLLGLWRAEFEGGKPRATLLLEKHPEFVDSFRGAVTRDGERAWLAGEVEEGELLLEESSDGRRITATWLGDVVEGSCGREVRGTWKADGATSSLRFVLRKQ